MANVNEHIRYEPDDARPPLLSLALALQGVVISLTNVVLFVTIAVGRLGDVPHGAPAGAGPCVAAVTLAMRATGAWRFWAPIIGIASGCAAAAFFRLYDVQRVLAASWVDLPDPSSWFGLELRLGAAFWGLLPMFVIVSLVTAIKMSSDGMVIQQVSWVRPHATDFRLVQGGLNANGLGTLLSGLAGTLPTAAYSPSAVSLINLTGVAARRVGPRAAGVSAQAGGRCARRPQSRHGGLSPAHGPSVRGRNPHGGPRRPRLSEGAGSGGGPVGRGRFQQSAGADGMPGPDVGRLLQQRHDGGHPGSGPVSVTWEGKGWLV